MPVRRKVCTKCKRNRELKAFTTNRACKLGKSSICKACQNALYFKPYYESHKEEATDRRFRYLYGITLEEYKRLAAAQNNRCAICMTETKLVVDHDHETHKVRGLLCARCNQGLGLFLDNTSSLVNAAAYLDRYKKLLR